MPIWMIMMGLQVVFFIVSAVWIVSWMHGKTDIYDEALLESARRYIAEREAQLAAKRKSEGQS